MLGFRTTADAEAVAALVREHLESGGLLGYPTETVYGFGSRPNPEDIARLVALKQRPPRKPFLLLASSRTMVKRLGLVLAGYADRIAEAFWPGPITLVLPGGEGKLPDALRGPEGGIAVRVTSHPAMSTLIHALDFPITSTSANRPGESPAAGAQAIVEQFPDAVASGQLLVLDGGVLGNQPPSTVVDCTGLEFSIIRDGAIARRDIALHAGSRP